MEVLDKNGLETYDNEIKKYIENEKVKIVECSFRIENGNLICDYPEGNETPDFSINSEGFLIFTTE